MLNMIVKHGPGQSLQGLSGVGIVCVGRNISELRALFLAASLEWNPLQPRIPPSKSTGDLCVPCHLLNQQGIFMSLSTFVGPSSLAFASTCSASVFFFFLWPLDHVMIV